MPRFLATDDWQSSLPVLTALGRRLRGTGFAATSVLPLPGNVLDLVLDPANVRAFVRGESNLFHHSALAGLFRRALARRHPDAVALHELLTLGHSLKRSRVIDLLAQDGLLDGLLAQNVVEETADEVRSNVVAAMSGGRLYFADATRLRDDPAYVYLGRSSFWPAEYLAAIGWRPPAHPPGKARRLLDLGCGAGPAAVAAAAAGVEEVIGTDIVERCLRYGRLNAALNGADHAEFRYSDVLSDVDGDFDLVVSNTPCVWDALQQATFATGGGDYGTALPVRMIGDALERLRPTGLMYVVVTAPIAEGEEYVVEVMRRACERHTVTVRIHPLLAEYEAGQRAVLRAHKISAFVRYGVVIGFAQRLSVSIEGSLDPVRYRSYRARALATRLAAAVVRA